MRYIRFLKPPKIQGHEIKALITITSDLGDNFCAEDVPLSASLRSAEEHGEIYLRKALKWTSGSRTLPILFNTTSCDIEWPATVHIAPRGAHLTDHFEKQHGGGDFPAVISAWSDILDPENGIHESTRTVERRFTPLNNRTLSIWEETGESIARHVWDAGLALTAALDRMIALQAEGLPLLEETISSATFKKLNVIELGSGCGIVGIGLAQSVPDCEVVLTDLPEAREIAERNIKGMNAAMGSRVRFLELDWDAALPKEVQAKTFDLILVADCTYNPDSAASLVRSIQSLVQKSPKCITLLAMKVRHESEMVFFDLMKKANFVHPTPLKLALPAIGGDQEEVLVYVFHHQDRPTYGDSTDPKLRKAVVTFWPE